MEIRRPYDFEIIWYGFLWTFPVNSSFDFVPDFDS